MDNNLQERTAGKLDLSFLPNQPAEKKIDLSFLPNQPNIGGKPGQVKSVEQLLGQTPAPVEPTPAPETNKWPVLGAMRPLTELPERVPVHEVQDAAPLQPKAPWQTHLGTKVQIKSLLPVHQVLTAILPDQKDIPQIPLPVMTPLGMKSPTMQDVAGATRGVASLVEGFGTPENVAIMAATQGLGAVPAIAKYGLPLIEAVFTAVAIEQVPELWQAYKDAPPEDKVERMTEILGSLGIGVVAGKGTAKRIGHIIADKAPPVGLGDLFPVDKKGKPLSTPQGVLPPRTFETGEVGALTPARIAELNRPRKPQVDLTFLPDQRFEPYFKELPPVEVEANRRSPQGAAGLRRRLSTEEVLSQPNAVKRAERQRDLDEAFLQTPDEKFDEIFPEERLAAGPADNAGTLRDYSSTQASLPPREAQAVRQMAQSLIDPNDVHPTEGLEADPHITVKYGLETDNPDGLRPLVDGQEPIQVRVGKVEIFKPEGKDYDVVVLRVESPRLRELNAKIAATVPNVETQPEYKPHITLGYVKKGAGAKYVDSITGLEGKTIQLDEIDFANRSGEKVPLGLGLNKSQEMVNALPNREAGREPGRLENADVKRRVEPAQKENVVIEPAIVEQPRRGDGGGFGEPGAAGVTTAVPESGKTRRIVTARENLVQRPKLNRVPERLAGNLNEAQQTGVNLAAQSLEQYGVFGLFDGTGVGKTRQIYTLSQIYHDRPTVVIAPKSVLNPIERGVNKGKVVGSYHDDAQALGIAYEIYDPGKGLTPGKVHLLTYEQMKKHGAGLRKGVEESKALLIFDESHNLKSVEEAGPGVSVKSKTGREIAESADKVVYASATPFDRPVEMAYLAKLGTKPGQSTIAAMRELGMTLRKNKFGQEYWAIDPTITHGQGRGKAALEVARRINSLFDRLTQEGKIIKREVSMDDVDVEFTTIPLDDAAMKRMEDVQGGFERFFGPVEHIKGLRKAHYLMSQRIQQEPGKIPEAVDAAKAAIASGKRVIIFTARINPSETAINVRGRGGEIIYRSVLAISEGTAKTLRQELQKAMPEVSIGELHGNANMASPEAVKRFNGGDDQILIATVESGGVGINLDDRIGNAPRKVIFMTPPFGAVPNVQAAGRVNRLTTKSPAEVLYLMADTDVDVWNAAIIAAKMETLGAAVSGDVRKLNIPKGAEEFVAPREMVGGGLPEAYNKKSVVTGISEKPLPQTGTLGDAVRELGKGLNALISDPSNLGQLNMGFGFSEKAYQRAIPHIKLSWEIFKKEGKRYVDLLDSVEPALRPYVLRYGQENKLIGFEEQGRIIQQQFEQPDSPMQSRPIEQPKKQRDFNEILADQTRRIHELQAKGIFDPEQIKNDPIMQALEHERMKLNPDKSGEKLRSLNEIESDMFGRWKELRRSGATDEQIKNDDLLNKFKAEEDAWHEANGPDIEGPVGFIDTKTGEWHGLGKTRADVLKSAYSYYDLDSNNMPDFVKYYIERNLHTENNKVTLYRDLLERIKIYISAKAENAIGREADFLRFVQKNTGGQKLDDKQDMPPLAGDFEVLSGKERPDFYSEYDSQDLDVILGQKSQAGREITPGETGDIGSKELPRQEPRGLSRREQLQKYTEESRGGKKFENFGFDEIEYQKAKPYLEKAYSVFNSLGKEGIEAFVDFLPKRFGENISAYAKRFRDDARQGKAKLIDIPSDETASLQWTKAMEDAETALSRLGEGTGKVGANLIDATKNLAQGLKVLFTDPSNFAQLNVGFAPSDVAYAKAKPHFEQAWNQYKAAGKSMEEFVREALDDPEVARNFRPYLMRFARETGGTPTANGLDEAYTNTQKLKSSGHIDDFVAGAQQLEKRAREVLAEQEKTAGTKASSIPKVHPPYREGKMGAMAPPEFGKEFKRGAGRDAIIDPMAPISRSARAKFNRNQNNVPAKQRLTLDELAQSAKDKFVSNWIDYKAMLRDIDRIAGRTDEFDPNSLYNNVSALSGRGNFMELQFQALGSTEGQLPKELKPYFRNVITYDRMAEVGRRSPIIERAQRRIVDTQLEIDRTQNLPASTNSRVTGSRATKIARLQKLLTRQQKRLTSLQAKDAATNGGLRIKNPEDIKAREAKEIVDGLYYTVEQNFGPAQRALVEKSVNDFYDYNKKLLEWYRDQGMINEEQLQAMQRDNQKYSPRFYLKYFEEDLAPVLGIGRGVEQRSSGIKRLTTGSTEALLDDPLYAMAIVTERLVTKGLKNRAARMFIDEYNSAANPAFSGVVEPWRETKPITVNGITRYEINQPPPGYETLSAYSEGKKYTVIVPEEYAKLLKESAPMADHALVGLMAMTVNSIRLGATQFNLIYGQGNPFRDIPAYNKFLRSIGAPRIKFFADLPIAYLSSLHGYLEGPGANQLVKRFYENLGGGSTQAEQLRITRVKPGRFSKTRAMADYLRDLGGTLEKAAAGISQVTEVGSRLAAFKRLTMEGYSDAEAATIAREILNFSRGGSTAKQISHGSPFFNSSIQGWERNIKTLANNYKRFEASGSTAAGAAAKAFGKELVNASVNLLAPVGAFVGAYYLATKINGWSQDDYKRAYDRILPTDRENAAVLITGERENPKTGEMETTYHKMPLPEFIRPYWQVVRNYLEAAMDVDDPTTAGATMLDALIKASPIQDWDRLIPEPFRGIAEDWANKWFYFDRPIVPESLVNAPPEEQETSKTSPTVKDMASVMRFLLPRGKLDFLQSPARLEHLTYTYMPFSRQAVGAVDRLRGLGPSKTGESAMERFTPFSRTSGFSRNVQEVEKSIEGTGGILEQEATQRIATQKKAVELLKTNTLAEALRVAKQSNDEPLRRALVNEANRKSKTDIDYQITSRGLTAAGRARVIAVYLKKLPETERLAELQRFQDVGILTEKVRETLGNVYSGALPVPPAPTGNAARPARPTRQRRQSNEFTPSEKRAIDLYEQ